MKRKLLIQCISLALASGGLTACGSGGGGDSTGSVSPSTVSTSAIGTIAGFGSIYVNGIKFETDDASYRIDDEDKFDDSALAVGMKVKVEGTINADGLTGTANSVFYDDDVEGPVDAGSLTEIDAATKTFTIFGLAVKASASETVFDDGASFDTLAEGEKLEVSGYFDGDQICATRIEKQDDLDDEFEIKGTVADYDGDTVTLVLQNGASAGPYTIDAGAERDIPADPTGLFVELKLMDQGDLVVIKIESDDDDLLDDDDDEVSVRGVLEDDGSGGFLINGIHLEVNDNTEYEPSRLEGNLIAGLEVKVEGYMQGDVLVADEVETEDGDIEIEARVIDVSYTDAKNGSVTLDLGNGQSLEVHTDNSTRFEDESHSDLDDDDSFNLDELAVGTDFVEIEAYEDGTGQLIATSIEREDEADDTQLKAPVGSFEPNASVTLLGITYTVDAGTSYEIDDLGTDATNFFNALSVNDIVEVKDVEPNGSAEELELED